MQAAAFWRGDIIKQSTMYSFLNSPQEGSLLNKLNSTSRNNLNVYLTRLSQNQEWIDGLDSPMTINKENYHQNYYAVKNAIINIKENIPITLEVNVENVLNILSTKEPRKAERQEGTVKETDDLRYLSPSQRIKWIKLHLDGFTKAVKETSNIPSGHLIYGKDTQKHITALIRAKVEITKIHETGFEKKDDGTIRHNLHPGLSNDDIKNAEEIQTKFNESITIKDIEDGKEIEKNLTVWEAIYDVGAKYGLFGVSDTAHRTKIQTEYKKLGKLSKADRETIKWLGELVDKDDFHELLLLYNEYEDIGLEMEEANLANNDKNVEELQIDEEQIISEIQGIGSQYNIDLLEQFKERIERLKVRNIDWSRENYTRTAGEVAERLGDTPGIDIREE